MQDRGEQRYVTADGKPSPWLQILQAATRVTSTYSRMLRLNPSARQSTPGEDRERPVVSAFEKIAMEAIRFDTVAVLAAFHESPRLGTADGPDTPVPLF